MSGEKWTPGEWRAGRGEFYPGLDGPLTTRVYTDSPPNEIDVSGDNCRANAYLVAAAPDLYAALALFEAHYPMGINPYLDDAATAARRALRKARGES